MQNLSLFINSAISLVFLFLFQTSVYAQNSVTKILILGDSLSAAHNIAIDQSWPALFSTNIGVRFPQTRVINASISGETTFGGVSRLPNLLMQHQPSHLIIELGGNDGLQGLNFEQTTANLNRMLKMANAQNIATIMIGVRMPPNLGAAYNQRFQAIFETVASQNETYYLPKFLEGVAASDPALMQSDGIHPTALAQPILAKKVFDAFIEMHSTQSVLQ
ncbi:MAG: acyl-CoA thioesterase-1 [Gammaproteobacteria bacterium]|jgi:acyl-CoA thioesterase-1